MRKNNLAVIQNILYSYFNQNPGKENWRSHDEVLMMCFGKNKMENILKNRSLPKNIIEFDKLISIIKGRIRLMNQKAQLLLIAAFRPIGKGWGYYAIKDANEGKSYWDKMKSSRDGLDNFITTIQTVARNRDPIGFEQIIEKELFEEQK